MSSEIKDREKLFHDRRFANEADSRADFNKYYSIAQSAKSHYRSVIRSHTAEHTNILEYGCGSNEDSDFQNNDTLNYYAIDISLEAIVSSEAKAIERGFKVKFIQCDAEKTPFEDSFFELIYGSGILHHLNIKSSLDELRRISGLNGSCVFFEPLGHNPLINFFRFITPNQRSLDEHPLRDSDFKLMSEYFHKVNIKYFYFFSLFSLFFRNTKVFNKILFRMNEIDGFLIGKFKWFGKFCWICVIELSQPIKD